MNQSEDTEVSPDSWWKSKSLLKLAAKGTEDQRRSNPGRTERPKEPGQDTLAGRGRGRLTYT